MPIGQIKHIIAGLSRVHGGPSYSVPALAQAQAETGADVQIHYVTTAGEPAPDLADRIQSFGYSASPISLLSPLRPAPRLRQNVLETPQKATILHAHGVWLLPNLYPAEAKRRYPSKIKLIHAPRGMLSKEAMHISGWKKWPIWYLAQRRALEVADCIHATAVSECEEIRALGLKAPVAIIGNGTDLAMPDRLAKPHDAPRVALALGRVHPKKGLDRLIEAWSQIEDRAPDWSLRIIGPSEGGHDEVLKGLAARLGVKRVSIEGPVFGEAKTAAYQSADLFVLPTRNENFGLVVAEALAAQVPVIVTKGAPWSGIELEKCGWWIELGRDPLVEALLKAITTPPHELAAMGSRGRAWMERDFGWAKAAQLSLDVYRWLQGDAGQPSCVQLY